MCLGPQGTAPGHPRSGSFQVRTSEQPADSIDVIARADLEFGRRPDTDGGAALPDPLPRSPAGRRGAGGGFPRGGDGPRPGWWSTRRTPTAVRRLAVEGVQIGQHCVRLYPSEVECTYRLALAVGQQARERPSTAVDGLDVMVELLDRGHRGRAGARLRRRRSGPGTGPACGRRVGPPGPATPKAD